MDTEMPSVEIPIEIISLFFSYLNRLEDRKSASLVCQKWNLAYQSTKFRYKEKVYISKQDHFTELLQISNYDYQIRNLRISDMSLLTDDSLPFWSRYGRDIYYLHFSNCHVSDSFLVQIWSQCSNLSIFSMADSRLLKKCSDVCMFQRIPANSLRSIRYLNFGNTSNLTDSMLCSLLNATPHLKGLGLSGSSMIFDNSPATEPESVEPKSKLENPLTFETIYQLLRAARRIVELDFSNTLITTDHFKLICDIPTLRLNYLNLSGCRKLTNEAILVLSKKQPFLAELKLNDCYHWLTDECLKYVGTMTKLEKLSLRCCDITDEGLVELKKLNLRSLNICGCMLTGEGLAKGLFLQPKPNLRTLKMGCLESIKERALISIVKNAPNLGYLDLDYCKYGVSNNTMQSIIRSCPKLEVLLAAESCSISDRGLTGKSFIKPRKPKRRTLAPGASKFWDNAGVNLKNLTKLKQLSLCHCVKITDESLIHGFEFSGLVKLDLSGCSKITHEGLKHVSEKNPSIEDLKLLECDKVHDIGVWYIMKNLKLLKIFWLGSNTVTDLSLTYLEEYGCNLKDLDIMHCSNIDEKLAVNLKSKLPKLKRYQYPNQPTFFSEDPLSLS